MKWLRLVRLPTVFTAMADIFLGFLLTHDGKFEPIADFLLLLAASACLYFAGMVFNDVFDLKKDQVETPNRPIPCGAISLRQASIFGATLCVAGVTLASLVSLPSLSVAVCIVVAVFAYDWLLKPTPLAPVAMGSCRFFNICLGASAVGSMNDMFTMPIVGLATGFAVYIAGLTWFARHEAVGKNKRDLIGGSVLMNVGVLILIGVVMSSDAVNKPTTVAILLLFVGSILDARLAKAVRSGAPPDIGNGIKTSLLSLVSMNASLVFGFTGNTSAAIAMVALLVPAMVVKRWIPLT